MPDAPIASPLPYLFEEDKHGDRQAREALFCTFNADLGYFERSVLGVTQSTGARVTVIGDARISDPDPRAARNAGTRYVHGLAAPYSGSAFHPKVTVIAGSERAVVAIGSGNLSPGGWHLNWETWTVAKADQERCPAIVAQAAQWLRTLAHVCAITPQAQQGISRTATLLENLTATGTIEESRHRLVHTSTVRLLDQLPVGDVARLLLYAPFLDERAAAVQGLIKHLQPTRVTLAVQSGKRTVIQPDAVRRVVTDLGVSFEVVEDTNERYRHGKLVEAMREDGSRWTLTGSPNLSAGALLLSAADGGNVEVGIVSQSSASMFPDSRPIELNDVPAVRITGSTLSRHSDEVTLLGATRTADGLEIVFAKPSSKTLRVLASSHAGFDQWAEIGTIPANVTAHVLAGVDLPGGTRVRCEGDEGAVLTVGGIVFVTDPALVLNRPGESTTRDHTRTPSPTSLITDPRLLEQWLGALGELAKSHTATALPRAAASAVPRGETKGVHAHREARLDTDEENWLAYTDDAKASVGTPMFHFVMGGFAGLSSLTEASATDLLEPTDKVIGENRPGLDEDDAAAFDDSSGPDSAGKEWGIAAEGDGFGKSVISRLNELTDHTRRRVRRDLEKAVDSDMPNLRTAQRLAILSLILCVVQAGFWDSPLGERGWIRVVGRALEKLDLDDAPERMNDRVASWAAIAIYLVHEHRPTTGRTAEVLQFEKAATAISHLLPEADADLVADLAAPFTNRNGYPVDPDAVIYVITMIVQDDPLTWAIDSLGVNHPEWHVHKHNDTLLHVHGGYPSTFLSAAEALDLVPDTGTAAVWATGITADWTIVVRCKDKLMQVTHNQRGQLTWRHYWLSNLTSPTGIARDPEVANRFRIRLRPTDQPSPADIQTLAESGIDISASPPSACPSSLADG